jgi:hypothetical protein
LKIIRKIDEIQRIGSRLSVAILPFDRRGKGSEVSEGAHETLTTALWNRRRFKIVERVELDRVLNEIKLSRTVLVDPTQAVPIGRLLAAEAVIVGSVKETATSAEVYARLISTETSAVMVAKDVFFEPAPSAAGFRNMLDNLAVRILESYPLIDGHVVNVAQGRVAVRFRTAGRGVEQMKMIVYQESEPEVHRRSEIVVRRPATILAEGSLVEIRSDESYIGMKSKALAAIERQLSSGKLLKVIAK